MDGTVPRKGMDAPCPFLNLICASLSSVAFVISFIINE
jgi:hypothetical protein